MSGYFLYHSIGMYEGKAEQMQKALSDYAQVWAAPDDGQWDYALGQVTDFKASWAELLNVSPDTVTFSENVTSGLYSIIGALGPEKLQGKVVLVAADCFPSLHFLLQKLAVRFNFTLRTVPLSTGVSYVTDDDFIAAWDKDVALALITWVSSTTSFRVDVDRLLETAAQYQTLTALDITQGAGVIPFQVTAGMDFVLSASLKWICGATGASALYINPAILEQCEPEYRGWFSQDNPFNWDIERFTYAPDARRFEHGTPSVLGSVASLPGMRYVLQQGVDYFFKKNRSQTQLIIEWAQAEGKSLLTPLSCSKRGGSIMVRMDSAGLASKAVNELRQQDIYIDARGDVVRISPGIISSSDKLQELCQFLTHVKA